MGQREDLLGYRLSLGIPTPDPNVFIGSNLGSKDNKFANAYINRLVVGPNTIYVENKNRDLPSHKLAINDLDGSDKLTIWQDIQWKDIPQNIQRLAIQYGIPINIFSSAAGTWQSKSKFTQFGLQDLITYANRKNLLGALNIKQILHLHF